MMNREMAERLNIALRTVEVHRAKVMEKMQAASLAELVIQLQTLPPTPGSERIKPSSS